MKTAAYIVIGLAVCTVVVLSAMIVYLLSKVQFDKNAAQTKAARDARWKEREQLEPKNESNEKTI